MRLWQVRAWCDAEEWEVNEMDIGHNGGRNILLVVQLFREMNRAVFVSE
jgi:hypothetical protein